MDEQEGKGKGTLESAQAAVRRAQEYFAKAAQGGSGAYYHSGHGETALKQAGIYAAVAQAEQLKRIADALENMSGAYATVAFGAIYPVAEGIVNPEDEPSAGPSPLDNW